MKTELVASLIALSGGLIVGKTRLQKTVFLLEKFGLESGFHFEYHNYGPYSADLAEACEIATAEGVIKAETKPGFYQVPYTVYSAQLAAPAAVGNIASDRAKTLLAIMKGFTAVDLELAATMVFLEDEGVEASQVDAQVAVLKPLKAKRDNLDKAHALLGQLKAA